MSCFFAFFLLAANTTFAQANPEGKAYEAISQELLTLKQELSSQQAVSLNAATAQTEIAATVKYRFYQTAGDNIMKLGVTQGVQQTYDLYTANGDRPSADVDAARADLVTLLNSL